MNKNFGGRAPGSANKITTEARKALKLIFDAEIDHLRENLETLPTNDRIQVLIKIMPWILPKLATEVIIRETPPMRFDFDIDVIENVNDEFIVTETYKINNDKI